MRSGTSFCNGAIFRKQLQRFWPIWASYLLLWALFLPVNGLTYLQALPIDGEAMLRFASHMIVGLCGLPGLAMALIFSLLAAMAACSHLYSARSANFMGALPVRREELFLSHYLAGLSMLLVPNLLVFLLTLAVEAAGGSILLAPLAFWLGYQCALDFFFYSFAVCIGMFAGHLLALPIFYVVFNCLVYACYNLLNWTMREFYFGFAGLHGWLYDAATWLTPALSLGRVSAGFDADEVLVVSGGGYLGVYAAVGLVLAVAALLLYRCRHLETAGDVVAVRPMRPVFKYAVALCAGLFFGTATRAILNVVGETGLAVSILLWGVAGYFVAQMLLDKSFRVLGKWKGAAAVAAVFAVLFLVVGFDLTGFETRVPDPDQVASVYVDGLYSTPSDSGSSVHAELSDSQDIALVTALHQAVVDQGDRDSFGGYNRLELTYTLRDGSLLEREYYVSFESDDMARLGQAVLDLREVRRQSYNLDQLEAALASGTDLKSVTLYDKEQNAVATYYSQEAQALLSAVLQDFDQGNLGTRTLDDMNPRYAYHSLVFSLRERSIEFSLPDTAAHTLDALDELGDLDALTAHDSLDTQQG